MHTHTHTHTHTCLLNALETLLRVNAPDERSPNSCEKWRKPLQEVKKIKVDKPLILTVIFSVSEFKILI